MKKAILLLVILTFFYKVQAQVVTSKITVKETANGFTGFGVDNPGGKVHVKGAPRQQLIVGIATAPLKYIQVWQGDGAAVLDAYGTNKLLMGYDGPLDITVNGIMEAKVFNVSAPSLAGADYVLQKDYKLKSLPEIEKYIATNNHLPEIPSANEMKQNGLNIAEFQIKLLQKIEELTLHVIEQQKQIDELKQQSK